MKCLTGESPTANQTPAVEQTPPAHISKPTPVPKGKKKSLKFIGLGNVPYIQAGGMLYILIKRVNGKRSDNFH